MRDNNTESRAAMLLGIHCSQLLAAARLFFYIGIKGVCDMVDGKTKAQLIADIADKEGDFYSNSFYQQRCFELHNVECSASVVTGALGRHIDRMNGSLGRIKQSARKLLQCCRGDRNLAARVLRRTNV